MVGSARAVVFNRRLGAIVQSVSLQECGKHQVRVLGNLEGLVQWADFRQNLSGPERRMYRHETVGEVLRYRVFLGSHRLAFTALGASASRHHGNAAPRPVSNCVHTMRRPMVELAQGTNLHLDLDRMESVVRIEELDELATAKLESMVAGCRCTFILLSPLQKVPSFCAVDFLPGLRYIFDIQAYIYRLCGASCGARAKRAASRDERMHRSLAGRCSGRTRHTGKAPLFGTQEQLPEAKAKRLRESWAWSFYELVFSQINEETFRALFSSDNGRPNAPINCLVRAEVLVHWRGWTVEELMEHVDFDLLTRTALGLDDMADNPFCQATLFNFRNRLLAHYRETGENLLEQVFDTLTSEQLERLGVRSDIQRCDSFQALSNISHYSRIQLLVEVLLRLVRVLREEDRARLAERPSPYSADTSQRFVYTLQRDALPRELQKLAVVYGQMHAELKSLYGDTTAFQVLERVFLEHFATVGDRIEARPCEELTSGTVQSPDDLDATYRRKHGEDHQGQVVNVVETANAENDVNLITDVAVAPNNTDDGVILNERLDTIKAKTPDINELHTDGAYGNADNDRRMAGLGVTHVQTAVRGRKAAVPIRIAASGEPGEYHVSCPNATVTSQPTRKRFKAVFPAEGCAGCAHANKCPAGKRKAGHRVLYFDSAEAEANIRNHNIETIPAERRTLRANVEATVKQFTAPLNHKGKLKVRGAFATALVVFSMAIGINFGRARRTLTKRDETDPAVARERPAATGIGPPEADPGNQSASPGAAGHETRTPEGTCCTETEGELECAAGNGRNSMPEQGTVSFHELALAFWRLSAGSPCGSGRMTAVTVNAPLSPKAVVG